MIAKQANRQLAYGIIKIKYKTMSYSSMSNKYHNAIKAIAELLHIPFGDIKEDEEGNFWVYGKQWESGEVLRYITPWEYEDGETEFVFYNDINGEVKEHIRIKEGGGIKTV